MADSILRLKVESQEYDNKLKQAAQGLTRYADECRKVGGTLEVVEKDTLDYVRALGQMDTVSRTATGKLAEMKKTFMELSVQYNRLTDEEKNGDYGKALSASLDQLKNRINESKSELDSINKSLNGSGGLSDALNSVAGKFGLSIDQVTKFGGVVGLTTTAVQVCKDAFFNSESNIDEWGRTVKGAEGAYQVFLDTLNNGNWSKFFHNLSLAIQGGRDLYDVFDRLGSIKSNNAAAIAIVQQQIAQLRLAKQQGENVDAQLKAATDRLAQLQKQSINAGKTAGTTSAFQTIRNSVNSIGGAGVNDATINYAVTRIMQNGQSEFDRYKYNYQTLQAKGTRTVITPGVGWDSQGNKNPDTRTQEFDISLLTKEQQKQYALAKAITEGETQIQKGIATYAQAVSEGTSSAREQFKGNRYALQGSGGSGGSGGTGGGSTFNPDTIAFKAMDGVKADPDKYFQSVWEMIGESGRKQIAETMDKQWDYGKDISEKPEVKEEEKLSEQLSNLSGKIGGLAGGLSSITSGFKSFGIELPKEVDSLIGVISGVSQIISGVGTIIELFSTTSQAANTVALTANTTMMGGLIAALQVNTATKFLPFANGGIVPHAAGGYMVPGNYYSGDVTPIMANAGELILNKSQQNNIASQLTQAGGGGRLVAKLRGRDILISLERELSETGKGQLATWR